jgi:rRNA-processing protein FCF1
MNNKNLIWGEIIKKTSNIPLDIEDPLVVHEQLTSLHNWVETSDIPLVDDFLPLSALAYPNYLGGSYGSPAADLKKWIQTAKDLYFRQSKGEDKLTALAELTNNWSEKESVNFLEWLKFYQHGNHLKYKMAQAWFQGKDVDYLLPFKPDKKDENLLAPSIDFAAKKVDVQDTSAAEQKKAVEAQKRKILSRLDSLEKLLRDHESQILVEDELEMLIGKVYELKTLFQKIKKTKSADLYYAQVIKKANILNHNKYTNAANVLFAFAGDVLTEKKPNAAPIGSVPVAADKLPAVSNPKDAKLPIDGEKATKLDNNNADAITDKTQDKKLPIAPPNSSGNAAPVGPSSGSGGAQPITPPATPAPAPPFGGGQLPISQLSRNQNEPNNSPDLTDSKKLNGISDFLSNVSGDKDLNNVEEDLEVDENDVYEKDGELVAEAQLAPLAPAENKPAPLPVADKAVATEPENGAESTITVSEDFDNLIDKAFNNITTKDVINKLEEISKIFRVREIPRQLAIVDLMLDRLGIASFFPNIAEASNKALESNNYIGTRIDDALSKLRGTLSVANIDLVNGEGKSSGKANDTINKLQLDEKKNQERQDTKAKLRDQELDNASQMLKNEKETPEINVEEDLAEPVVNEPVVETPKPAIPKPVTPAIK